MHARFSGDWGGYTITIQVPSGVRQGGVLSPHLFIIYVDDLINDLRQLNNGCFIAELFMACIIYADDICLLAPCRSALQTLLDTCEAYGNEWCLAYNPSKSKILTFGSSPSQPVFTMYGKELCHVNDVKYLGVTLVAGTTFSVSHAKSLIRFRSSANTILNVTHRSSEPMLMKLLYSICVPHLTYASEVISYSMRQFHPLNVALNDCIRRVFGYNRWESVRFLRQSMGYPSLTDIVSARARQFRLKLTSVPNTVLQKLAVMDPI